MDRINAIAHQAGAMVVEDCALALDATFDGAKAGTLGACGSFSFYPVKHMTTIEGGMVTTNDDALAAQLTKRRSFGYNRQVGERARPGLYDVDALGFNYRMSEVAAAVGLAQMAKLDGFQAARARNHAEMAAAVAGVEGITVFPAAHGGAQSSHYCLNVVMPRDGSVSRDAVQDALKARGVGTSIHYPGALPLFTYYREKYGYKPGQFPVAEWLAAGPISLPIGPHLAPGQAKAIGEAVAEAVAEVRPG
jgi:dTDP-4-amino-4,6-dideoxygalactose transaminase